MVKNFIKEVINEMPGGEITKLALATSKTKASLRTTVPSFIVKQFDLKPGDMLDWSIKAEGGTLIILVKPIKKN